MFLQVNSVSVFSSKLKTESIILMFIIKLESFSKKKDANFALDFLTTLEKVKWKQVELFRPHTSVVLHIQYILP